MISSSLLVLGVSIIVGVLDLGVVSFSILAFSVDAVVTLGVKVRVKDRAIITY